MKSITTYINEAKKYLDADEYLSDIVNSAQEDPAIWDDTESWEAKDDFDYWQDANGSYDDVIEFISEYADEKRVAGWKTDKSFEETEKIIPKKLKTIMKKTKPEIPYKKRYNQMEVWQAKDNEYNVTVMKFKYYANNEGTDYIEYWYMFVVEN